jgi:ribosomal subunit interface protein
MNIEWTFRGDSLEDDLRQRIEQQLQKLDKFFRQSTQAQVVVAYEGPQRSRVDLEMIIRGRTGTFTGKGSGHDIIDVARDVLKRVESQVQRSHDKIVNSRRDGATIRGVAPAEEA